MEIHTLVELSILSSIEGELICGSNPWKSMDPNHEDCSCKPNSSLQVELLILEQTKSIKTENSKVLQLLLRF